MRWLAPALLVTFIAVGVRACREADKEASFAPLHIIQLEVEPATVVIGQPARLHNGFCSSAKTPLRAGFYLGLQQPDVDPIQPGSTVDLIGRDTPEGRQRADINPGCTRAEPFEVRAVPMSIPTGMWRAVLHIVVLGPNGETQSITERSSVFTVVQP